RWTRSWSDALQEDQAGEKERAERGDALETEIREHDQGKALQDHAGLQRSEQRDADNAQQRKRDKKTLAEPGTIGERAEQRSGQHHEQQRSRDRAAPPQIAEAMLVADDVRDVVDGEDGRDDDGGVRRI